jgi:hypothetical protein
MGDPEIDAQEDENITHTAVVSQEPLPGTTNRIKIPILNKQVFFIPLQKKPNFRSHGADARRRARCAHRR